MMGTHHRIVRKIKAADEPSDVSGIPLIVIPPDFCTLALLHDSSQSLALRVQVKALQIPIFFGSPGMLYCMCISPLTFVVRIPKLMWPEGMSPSVLVSFSSCSSQVLCPSLPQRTKPPCLTNAPHLGRYFRIQGATADTKGMALRWSALWPALYANWSTPILPRFSYCWRSAPFAPLTPSPPFCNTHGPAVGPVPLLSPFLGIPLIAGVDELSTPIAQLCPKLSVCIRRCLYPLVLFVSEMFIPLG